MARAPAIRLLVKLLEITAREGIPVAIGGGLAVNAHGYRRETQDVDAFFRLEDRLRVIRALREAGFVIERLFAPNHYAAFPPRARNVQRRIDLLFPEGDPGLAAIEQPQQVAVADWKLTVPVFPVELLVVAKLQVVAEPASATSPMCAPCSSSVPSSPRPCARSFAGSTGRWYHRSTRSWRASRHGALRGARRGRRP